MNFKENGVQLNMVDIFEGLNPNTVELIFEYNDEDGDMAQMISLCKKFGINWEVTEDGDVKYLELLISTKLK